jgi:hypothetical protein
MAILQTDVLDYARQQNLFPGIDSWATYITKLYNEEFHLLARQDIKSIAELANQKINVDLRGAAYCLTGECSRDVKRCLTKRAPVASSILRPSRSTFSDL